MFCREVGTTSIRGISDKNKAEIPSKKTFFWGGGGYRCNRQGPGRRGCERPLGGGVCGGRPRCVWRECGAETMQGGGAGGKGTREGEKRNGRKTDSSVGRGPPQNDKTGTRRRGGVKKRRKGRNNAERMRDEGSNDKTKKSGERGGKQILRYAQNDREEGSE